jgi:outer membrane receptor protein involved in Fe transport
MASPVAHALAPQDRPLSRSTPRWLLAGCRLAAWCLVGLSPSLRAQDVKGGIRGTVRDVDFGAAVPNARVTLVESGRTVTTDEGGAFFFNDVSPGAYELYAQREGYRRSEERKIVVNAGAVLDVDFSLEGEVVELDDFMVSQEDLVGAGDAAKTLDIQQSLSSFATVLGADFISKIGASDVGKALTKVAGINIIGDRYVVVRGLSDRYNAILLNSAGVPSSDPDRRAPNIDLFPGSIVKTLQTSKTFSPDLPGEATGGSINIVTKGVPEKSFFKGKVGWGYDTLATGNKKFLTYQGGGTGILGTLEQRRLPDFIKNAEFGPTITSNEDAAFRERINNTLPRTMGASEKPPDPDFQLESSLGRRAEFFGKPAGILIATDYRKQYRFDDAGREGRYQFVNGEPVIVSRLVGVTRGTETLRGSFLIAAGVEPQPGDEVKVTLFSNIVAQDRAALRVGPRDFGVLQGPDPNEALFYRESLAYTERRLHVLQASGRHHWDGIPNTETAVLNWFASYNLARQDEPDHRFIEARIQADGTYSPAVFDQIPNYRRYFRELDDTRWNIGLNSELLLFSNSEQKTKLKAGGGLDVATREYDSDSFAYNATANYIYPTPTKPVPYPGATVADAFNYNNAPGSEFLYRFGREDYDSFLGIPSAFMLIDSDFTPKVNLNVGLRFEQSNYRIEGSDILNLRRFEGPSADALIRQLIAPEDRTPANLSQLSNLELAAKNPVFQKARFVNVNESHVLPAISIKYRATDTINLRGSFSRTIARPSIKEYAPVVFRDAESGDQFLGNSSLKISNIDNIDVRAEWYPPGGGSLALSGFTKFIEDPIELVIGAFQQFQNGADATVYGGEIEYDRDLSFLSETLRPFTIGGNYTYIKSVTERIGFTRGLSKTRRLQGQPDYILNFNLTYDNSDMGLSMGTFLNVTGVYLDAAGSIGVPDIYVEPTTTLNAFVSLKIGKNAKLTLRASNLTSEPVRRVYDNGSRSLYDQSSTSTNYSVSFEGEW